MMKTEEFDIIVIGAGVAGGVFAASQPSSTRILVVERDLSEPDRIIGELMQPGGIQALKELDLVHLIDGIDAQEVNGYNLIKGNERFTIHYDEVQEGIRGVGLRNGKFLGNGISEIKHSKLILKENSIFPISGTYTVSIWQAMRNNGSANGINQLQGITDVGLRIEKVN